MSNESRKNIVEPNLIDEAVIESYPEKYRRIASILHSRNILPDDLERFINPDISALADYKKLYGAKEAAVKIIDFAKKGKKIYIHGDFDSDGICATSLLWNFLYRDLAKLLDKMVEVVPYIPGRVDEGYGLSEQSVEAMKTGGAELIITVDCGIRDKELIKKHTTKKLQFIVTDHHQPPEDLEDGLDHIVVHQLFPGHEFPHKDICGTAVAFLLIEAIKAKLGDKSKVSSESKGLDLVALATVTDMMPLLGINRAFVKFGIEQMQKSINPGLGKLCELAKVNPAALESYHLGFVIGPRINAAGRIGSAMDAVRLLLSEDEKSVSAYASKLDRLNMKRQKMTDEVLNASRKQVDSQKEQVLNFIIGEGWAEGIIGLVAGKIQEFTGKPTIVVTKNNGEIRGSARSLPGLNITESIGELKDMLVKYGGHELAAGFTVKEGMLDDFSSQLQDLALTKVSLEDLKQELKIDMLVTSQELKISLVEALDQLKPFGYGNKKPVLMIKSVVVTDKFAMGAGKNHLKLTFKDGGIGIGNGVMFNCAEDIKKINTDDKLDLIGAVNINEWNGNTDVQFMINEWRRAA